MNEKYRNWIVEYVERHDGKLLGRCKEATAEMHAAFPELKIVRGHVFTDWGQRGHFWCETEDKQIVDPTKEQFNLIFEYQEWIPGTEVRVGKCMNCGEEIWRPVQSLDDVKTESMCSKECERDFMHALSGEFP